MEEKLIQQQFFFQENITNPIPAAGVSILFMSYSFVIMNLSLHIVLRSLWVSAIGLRYVSGEIEVERLRLSSVFQRYLGGKRLDFDHYIMNLERYWSLIFALYFIFFMFLTEGIDELLPRWPRRIVIIVIAFSGLLYLIDFSPLEPLNGAGGFPGCITPFIGSMVGSPCPLSPGLFTTTLLTMPSVARSSC